MAVDLVIFDCDGVLVDSEPLAARVLAEALLDLGMETTVEAVDGLFRGRSLRDIVKNVEEILGAPVPEDFLPKLNSDTQRAFDQQLTPIAGVREVLSSIAQRGLDMCVASSGSPEKIRHSLARTDLAAFFEDRVFSASQVERGKPAPDLFLFAAKQMGHDIRASVIVEDSIPGVAGALASGASVFGFVSPSLYDPVTHADALAHLGAHVFHSMDQLPALLARRDPILVQSASR